MLLYGIKVQMYFPNTMKTPGYEEESKIRPEITSKIEEGDQPSTAEEAAKIMVDGMPLFPLSIFTTAIETPYFSGVRKGHVQISGDILTSLFRASTRGSTPRVSFLKDAVLDFVSFVRTIRPSTAPRILTSFSACQWAVPIWRISSDGMVSAHGPQHLEYLKEKKIL